MSETALWLVGNVGAEEPRDRPAPPHALAVARLLALSFPADARLLLGDRLERVQDFWPRVLGRPASEPAFPWLAEHPDHAWLPTASAQSALNTHGRGSPSPTPEVVRPVHDKAFTVRTCRRERLLPPLLRGLAQILEPEALRAPDATDRLHEFVETWPAWTQGHFALKPRLGTSGRGRVPGRGAQLDLDALRTALPRLAERGGAILEPWLERLQDLSVQLHIGPAGDITLLGTLSQIMSPSGVWRGHQGRIDHRGRITSLSHEDDGMLDAAIPLAQAAAGAGFHGPCGIDAFTFQGPEGTCLHPALELNARFTTGTAVLGLLRRTLPRISHEIGLAPGTPRFFHFALTAPARGWPDPSAEVHRVSFRDAIADVAPELDPALLFAPSPDALHDLLQA